VVCDLNQRNLVFPKHLTMKNFSSLLCVFCFFSAFNVSSAQDLYTDNYSPIYNRSEAILSNTDTIPDYRSKTNKLKLTGTIYQSDGITPAPDVILFIEQPDEDGNFELRKTGDNRYVFHRSWVKTDADGVYTFYTFVPGNDRRYNQLQQIFPTVKAPFKEEYQLETFLFDEDPLLTKRCRKKIEKMSHNDRILKLKQEDGMLVAQRDIILGSDVVAIN
jgi:protocatechuate 3,4-dioxygenase beta subunit